MIMNGYNMFIKEQRVDRQNLAGALRDHAEQPAQSRYR
jgi:hypothetical protein